MFLQAPANLGNCNWQLKALKFFSMPIKGIALLFS